MATKALWPKIIEVLHSVYFLDASSGTIAMFFTGSAISDVIVTNLLIEQQPTSFFAAGIEKLVPRWDKCLNVLGGYVEK